jgi:VWFA-related protein
MRLTRLRIFSAALAFCLPHLLGAQGSSPTPPFYDANEGLIRLDVVVTDQAGKPASGIAAQDITLLDDGKPAKIRTFHAHDGTSTVLEAPVTVILLVDTLNLPERMASYERREVERFLQQNGGHLAQPVSLLEFSNMGILTVGQPSDDGNTLAAEFAHNNNLEWIRRVPGELRGESLDTLLVEPPGLSALKALGDIATTERQLPGRKLLIWVGPGWAVGSGAYMDSMEPKQNTFDAIEWFSTLLREARISLYSFSVGETNADGRSLNYLSFLSGVKSVQQATFMHLNRKVLAVQTGGRVLAPSADLIGSPGPALTDFKPNADLVLQINSCIREASTFYTLSFDPSYAGHLDEYHDLKVQVDNQGLTVRTTTGYYDQPYYSDQGRPAVRPVTVEQLEQLITVAHDRPDAEQVRQLSELTLTERLSRLKFLNLSAVIRGGKARQAFVALADASAFLDPPAKEIPADAPPDHDAQQRIASLALEYLNKALPNLPNFYATRTAVHYQENPPFEKGDAKITYQPLHVADTVKDTVFYRNGYEVGESDSGKNKKRKVDEPYLVTYGTFGPILRGALDAMIVAPNGLSWRRWENDAGKSLAVFGYVIAEEKSAYDTGGCCLSDGEGTGAFRSRVGYHGEIAIDPTTGAILRLELIFDLKSTTPLNRSEIMVEYGPVEIAGKTYICPVRSVSISRGRSVVVMSETLNARAKIQWRESFRTYGPYATMLNDITFDTFHLFHADSHMLTGFSPAPE